MSLEERAAEPTHLMLAGCIERVAVAQDKAAFATLFAYFAPRLKAFFRRRGASDTGAEDLAQEAMLRIWRSAAQFDQARATPATWVFAIARNLRADALRRRQRQFDEDFSDEDFSEIASPEPGPEAAAMISQAETRLHVALMRLPEAQRAAIRLAYLDELSHSDAHRVLDVALGTFKSRLRLALTRLRAALEEK